MTDTSIQADYASGATPDASANAGNAAARNNEPLAPQQPGESWESYMQRQAAYATSQQGQQGQ